MSARNRRKRRRRQAAIGWLVVLLLAATLLIPGALVLVGTRKATACMRTYEAPRGAELPWCGDAMDWFSLPARVPWTVTPATYRAEELRIRIAIGHYQNAAVGQPDRAARAKAAELVVQAATIVRTGSQRLAFEELGPAVGMPDPGQDALLVGDRDTLLRSAKQWGEWHQRLHTLRAALLEGDLPRAVDIAKHYATYDPREDDLRAALGAVLCLGGETRSGLDMFVLQQNDRSARRYAAMSRNWGDVRTALLACAALGKVAPPPRPGVSEAGQDDQREVRAPLRLHIDRDNEPRLREAQNSTVQMLSGALPAGSRAPILAALLASGMGLSAETWADLATARTDDGEPPLLDVGSVNVLSWLDVPSGRPIAVGAVYRRAATRLEELAARSAEVAAERGGAASGGAASGVTASGVTASVTSAANPGDATTATEDVRATLQLAAGALWLEGARACGRAADTTAAVEMLERAAPLVQMDAATQGLAEGLVRYATGDVEGAHAALQRAGGEGSEPEMRAAALTLRAEVSRALGRPSQEEALAAYEAAAATDSAALLVWARRVRLWAAPWTEPKADVDITKVDAMAGRFALWPSLGYANRTVQWSTPDDPRLAVFDRNIGVWAAMLGAAENEQRAFRYALVRGRGDMPDSLVPYLAVAGEAAGSGDTEVWLDAVMATDAPRFSLRSYAWARAQVARARGDHAAEATWSGRFKGLAKFFEDQNRAELARLFGI